MHLEYINWYYRLKTSTLRIANMQRGSHAVAKVVVYLTLINK